MSGWVGTEARALSIPGLQHGSRNRTRSHRRGARGGLEEARRRPLGESVGRVYQHRTLQRILQPPVFADRQRPELWVVFMRMSPLSSKSLWAKHRQACGWRSTPSWYETYEPYDKVVAGTEFRRLSWE